MLELEGVNTFRGPAHVLHNLSLKVGDRESVCLVGRNGAGKTTTIDGIGGRLACGRSADEGGDGIRGPAHVLHNLSLKVGDRESVYLVGRNGAGKTTTIDETGTRTA